MDIASYPIGILIGLFPVLVDLGPTGKPAELLLDGKPACEITARAPGCTIDLGAAPRIHRLDLVRRDPSGQVVEKVSRWVSRPGLQAEVDASGDCEDRSRTCTFHVGWGHPAKQDPKTLLLSLDGVIVHTGVSQAIRIRFPGKGWPPQVVSVDAVFPDGRRANSTHLLRGSYPEETEASLQAVPLQSEAGPLPPDLAAELTAAGWNLKALEEGEDEIVFVVEPGALTASSRMDEGAPRLLVGMLRSGVLGRTGVDGVRATHVVVGNEDLAASEVRPASPSRVRRSVWLDRLLNAATTRFSWARTADAVAAAGYSVAGSPRRRLLVLVLGSDTRDESVMSSHAVLDYLEQALVPIVVWRMGATAGAGWPEGPRILNLADFRREAEVLRFTLDHQRVAWIDGRIDLRDFRPSLPAGVRLAGRKHERDAPAASGQIDSPGPPATEPASAPDPLGFGTVSSAGHPAPGVVFALARDPVQRPERIWAAAREGLFRKDGDGEWEPVRIVSGILSANTVAAAGGEVVAGTDGGLARSVGGESWVFEPMIPILAVLGTGPGSEGSLLASVRGHIRSSAGVGARWTLPRDNPSRGFVLSLAAHPDHPGVFYAGTSGEGLLRSTDGGGKWAPLSRQLGRTGVRAIAVDGALPGILWLATDEGVLGSGDGGLTWAAFNQGLARGPIYAIAIDPWRPGILYAGGAGGLFRSDFGQVWTSVALPKSSGGVLSLLFREDGDLLVGTRNTGVLELCLFE